jgi:hypothetical protein
MDTATSPATSATASVSPGTAFAAAFATQGENTRVTYDYTITDAHKPDRPKPRLTVRGLLKRRPADGEITYWCEGSPSPEQLAAVSESGLRREAAFQSGMARAQVYPVQAWVQIPDGLAGNADDLASYIDHRLLVRIATAENQALTIGPHGLLHHPGINKMPYEGDYADAILAACDEIEQIGSTAHALIVNPADYYRTLVGRGSLLADLAANGTLISRTRMIPQGQALAGDFAEAVRLLDAGRSVISVTTPPPGTFAEPGIAVCGEVYEGLAVHLPTHLFLAHPAGSPTP